MTHLQTKAGLVVTVHCAAEGCLILFCGVSVSTIWPVADTFTTTLLLPQRKWMNHSWSSIHPFYAAYPGPCDVKLMNYCILLEMIVIYFWEVLKKWNRLINNSRSYCPCWVSIILSYNWWNCILCGMKKVLKSLKFNLKSKPAESPTAGTLWEWIFSW